MDTRSLSLSKPIPLGMGSFGTRGACSNFNLSFPIRSRVCNSPILSLKLSRPKSSVRALPKLLQVWKFFKGEDVGCGEQQERINGVDLIPVSRQGNVRDNFLTELLKNSCQVLDLIQGEGKRKDPQHCIRILVDKANKCICISDTGSGMTKADLENLASVTSFVSKKMRAAAAIGAEITLFGFGFYSLFFVADPLFFLAEKVVVTSKHNDDEQYIWESLDGNSSFTISRDDSCGEQLTRGTKITIFLKEDHVDYLEESRITHLLKTHPVKYPVFLWAMKTKEKKELSLQDYIIRLKNGVKEIFHRGRCCT